MKFSIYTFGCKVNQFESQAMGEMLEREGYAPAESDEKADVLILNSCTVTAASDAQVRKKLRRWRRENPEAILVLCGCLPQAFPDIAEHFAEADVILGNKNRSALAQRIMQRLSSCQQIVDISPHTRTDEFEAMPVARFAERTRAFLKIEDGCNRYCAYCIIPKARGQVRSRSLVDIREQVERLANSGYREIVLTGINLSAYGQDIGLHLCDAVDIACAQQGVERVRLGSLEPERMSDEAISRFRRQEKLCPQFHLSLQSGCDETLRAMNRHYTAAEYEAIVEKLRAYFPQAAITTDIMVGFPGESAENFQASLSFVKRIGFAKAHIFMYSKRPGTVAAMAEDQVLQSEKERRSSLMIEACDISRQQFFQAQQGMTVNVLFEQERAPGEYYGLSENYTPICVNTTCDLAGNILPVRILSADGSTCKGELI